MTFAIDAGGDLSASLLNTAAHARQAEQQGADGVILTETKHDSFVALTLAAEATERVALFSAITVAFSRNPMTVAVAANDIQELSAGRLILGLGSQVQPHIEKRFSMPWSAPAARMREFVGAVREIWSSFASGNRPSFRGEFYTHTLMNPVFDPGPNPHGNPPIWLAGVGEKMTEVVGEVADGLVAHPFTTRPYVEQVTLPALRHGAEHAGRDVPGIAFPVFVALGHEPAEIMQAALAVGKQIAFYGSTPSYLPVLEVHGWGAKGEQLNAAVRRGEWGEIGRIIDEEMLREFACVGTPEQVAAQIEARYGDLAERVTFSAPYDVRPELWAELYAALRR
ncbi:MAG: TIGR03617 family F420-dependent LLM class oxidoreductase [Microbacteriaceae bacterium]|nr:TIGR03617 family F420-dependent LLM class oxidoreductase [Microbacteriaceae bacterium]